MRLQNVRNQSLDGRRAEAAAERAHQSIDGEESCGGCQTCAIRASKRMRSEAAAERAQSERRRG